MPAAQRRAVTAPDHLEACAQLARLGHRVTKLVAAAPSLDGVAPGLTWTAGEVVAHLSTQADRFAAFAAGTAVPQNDLRDDELDLPAPQRAAAVNARLVAAVPRAAPAELAAELHARVEALAATLRRVPPDAEFRSWEGDSDATTAAATYVGELLVHGRDVARALRRPWPLPAGETRTALHAVLRLLPAYVEPGRVVSVDAVVRVRVRGGPDVVLSVRDGVAAVGAVSGERVDCTVAVTPQALLLLAFGRTSLLRAVCSGQVVAWGRRPLLSRRMLTWFSPP